MSQIRELVPESQAYMDLLAFERKLDQTIMRKRLDIQEALKRPIKVCTPTGIPLSLQVRPEINFKVELNDMKKKNHIVTILTDITI